MLLSLSSNRLDFPVSTPFCVPLRELGTEGNTFTSATSVVFTKKELLS